MTQSPLSKKLGIKPGYQCLILSAPDGYIEMLDPLPDGATIRTSRDGKTTYDLVQDFVKSKAEVDAKAQPAIDAVKQKGLLWLTYPKKTSKIKTDIHRDVGWEAVYDAGWEGVSLISVDDTWSAMRYRPHEEIKARQK